MKLLSILLTAVLYMGAAYAQEPQPKDSNEKAIAFVLGKMITDKDKNKLHELIGNALFEKFAQDNNIQSTEEELYIFILKTEVKKEKQTRHFKVDREKLMHELTEGNLSEHERKERESRLQVINNILKKTEEMKQQPEEVKEKLLLEKRQIARHFVQRWKVNKALYAKYGGRIIFQQVGTEPFDAYRNFLREEEKKRSFEITDEQCHTDFWRYFSDDAKHIFCSKDECEKLINNPWWLMDELPNK